MNTDDRDDCPHCGWGGGGWHDAKCPEVSRPTDTQITNAYRRPEDPAWRTT